MYSVLYNNQNTKKRNHTLNIFYHTSYNLIFPTNDRNHLPYRLCLSFSSFLLMCCPVFHLMMGPALDRIIMIASSDWIPRHALLPVVRTEALFLLTSAEGNVGLFSLHLQTIKTRRSPHRSPRRHLRSEPGIRAMSEAGLWALEQPRLTVMEAKLRWEM